MKYYGIYKLMNLVNGKMYIGQHVTDDLDDGYMGSGICINHAIKKYGKEAFTKEWLEFAENAEDLNYLERMYVDEEWLAKPDTYNLTLGGVSHREFSKSTKELISENTKKAMADPKVKAKCSKAKKGKTPWNKGKQGYYRWSEEKYMQAQTWLHNPRPGMKGKTPWNKGKKMDQQTRSKVSYGVKNAMTEEVRQKIAAANKNRIGKVYWNNGKDRVLAAECPGEAWVRGRTISKE